MISGVTAATSYSDLTRDRYFVSSEGSEIREDLVTTRVSGTITSKDGTLTKQSGSRAAAVTVSPG